MREVIEELKKILQDLENRRVYLSNKATVSYEKIKYLNQVTNAVRNVCNKLSGFKYLDYWLECERRIQKLLLEDKLIDGVTIVMPLKPKKTENVGYINLNRNFNEK